MKNSIRTTLIALSLSLITNVGWAETPAPTFRQVAQDFWGDWLSATPLLAVSKGHDEHLTSLPDPSAEGRQVLAATLKHHQARLSQISPDSLNAEDRTNYAALSWILSHEIEQLNSPVATLLPFHTVYSWLDQYVATFKATNWPGLPGELYPAHLQRLITYIHQQQQVLTEGVAQSYTQQCDATARFVRNLEGRLNGGGFSAQLRGSFPTSHPQYNQVRDLSEKAVSALTDYTTYLKHVYAPRCRKDDGIWAWAQGDDLYAQAVRYYTSTDLSPEAIHQIGLREVARIRAEVEALRTSAEIQHLVPTRSLAELFDRMRGDPVFFASSREEIIAQANRVMKSVKGGMTSQFDYPSDFAPFHIAAIPSSIEQDSAAAFYYPNATEGTLYFNTYLPETRKTFSIAAIAIHEGIPGHHYQLFSLLNNTDAPAYRQEYYFHASGEGFALYTESLMDDIYPNASAMDKLGVLSMELLRAGRLVVDTGLHAKRWTVAQGNAYLLANTGMSAHEVESEVIRFVSYPGQATSYKVGQLAILSMRQHAEETLGTRFDVKAFHRALVANSSLPISVLKDAMLDWERRELKRLSRVDTL